MVIQLFDKILVPVDGSKHSLKALDVAIQIAKRFNKKITLMHVYSVVVTPVIMPEPSTLTTGVPIMTSMEVTKLVDTARQAGKRILDEGKERAKAEGVETDEKLEEGHVVQEIIRVSKADNVDLIVIGARGISHIREMLLGSVTDGVIHHVDCPVMVVK